MELNFDAVVRLTEALLPLLRASAPSAIVNVASTAGRVSRARTGAYSASKFALIGWTDSLYAEISPPIGPRRVIRCGDGAQLSERASHDVLAITILLE